MCVLGDQSTPRHHGWKKFLSAQTHHNMSKCSGEKNFFPPKLTTTCQHVRRKKFLSTHTHPHTHPHRWKNFLSAQTQHLQAKKISFRPNFSPTLLPFLGKHQTLFNRVLLRWNLLGHIINILEPCSQSLVGFEKCKVSLTLEFQQMMTQVLCLMRPSFALDFYFLQTYFDIFHSFQLDFHSLLGPIYM